MSDVSKLALSLRDYFAGKHPDDTAAQKIVKDVDEFLAGAANAAKDVPALVKDGGMVVVDVTAMFAQHTANVASLVRTIADLTTLVEDLKKTVDDFKAGEEKSS